MPLLALFTVAAGLVLLLGGPWFDDQIVIGWITLGVGAILTILSIVQLLFINKVRKQVQKHHKQVFGDDFFNSFK